MTANFSNNNFNKKLLLTISLAWLVLLFALSFTGTISDPPECNVTGNRNLFAQAYHEFERENSVMADKECFINNRCRKL